ncbi:MAG TPA: histidine kinase [Acidimicrobiales bacterium]|nr:histidine kinase [Acidimicrobiales bacterium]
MPRTLRWTLPLALVAIGFLVAVTVRAHPGPGVHGEGLGVSIALVAFGCALVSFERVPAERREARMLLLAAMIGCAAGVFALQASGPGFLMMYPPVAAAAFRFPRSIAVAVLGIGLTALALGATFGHARPVDSVILDELAVAGYFGVAVFAGRFIIADEHSQLLINQLEQTRLAEARAAALAERQRLAREMHDVLAHSLSGLVINLESARVMGERGVTGAPLEQVLTRSHSLAKTGLEEARRAIRMLRDDDPPGPARLADLVSEFRGDTGVAAQLIVDGEERELPADCQLTLYRVTQEALTNIRKHAYPDRVEVRLSYEPSGTRLVVTDHNSTGRRRPPQRGTGYGLTGMRERAESVGGDLVTGPTDDGFRVELWAPS